VKRRLIWIIPVLAVLLAAALYWYFGRDSRDGAPVLTFCGGAREVGGSCHLVETAAARFIVDCGDRGSAGAGVLPPEPETLSFVLLTHAHTDHCGLLPELFGNGFDGRVYCSAPTVELVRVMLKMTRNIGRRSVSSTDFERALDRLTPVRFDEVVNEGEISFRFTRAGHLLGAACIEVWAPAGDRSVKIVFSGDLGSRNLILVSPPAPVNEAEYVVMESTYGGTVREYGEGDLHREFAGDVTRTLEGGGDVLIPSFALGRTQEVAAVIDRYIKAGVIPPETEVYIDSPTANKITDVYRRFRVELSAWTREFYAGEILRFPGLREVPSRTSLKVHDRIHPPSVFVSTSGDLCYANSPRHLMRMFGDSQNLLCIVGWQAPGSTGARLTSGESPVLVRYREGGESRREWISPLIKVERYHCFSGHADQPELLSWLRKMRGVRQVFLVHGEPDEMEALAERIRDEIGLNVKTPGRGEHFVLRAARTRLEETEVADRL
jgi:metallo-beta-lactamase family protein